MSNRPNPHALPSLIQPCQRLCHCTGPTGSLNQQDLTLATLLIIPHIPLHPWRSPTSSHTPHPLSCLSSHAFHTHISAQLGPLATRLYARQSTLFLTYGILQARRCLSSPHTSHFLPSTSPFILSPSTHIPPCALTCTPQISADYPTQPSI